MPKTKNGWVFYTLADARDKNRPRRNHDHEAEYRRGYRDGFGAATNAVYDLWFLGKERSQDVLFDFWKKQLWQWRHFKVDKFFPPSCTVMCSYCQKHKAEHLDHIYPKSRGGSDDEDNLVPACASCNCSKYNLTPEEWKEWKQGRRKR